MRCYYVAVASQEAKLVRWRRGGGAGSSRGEAPSFRRGIYLPWLLGAAWLGLGVSGAAIGAGIALSGRRERRKLSAAAVPRPQRQH